MKNLTATETIGRVDLRRRRSEGLVHVIMQWLQPYLADDINYGRVAGELFNLLRERGYEVLSDFDRQEIGLPPRGPDGWTVEEIIALEKARLDAITRPMVLTTQFIQPK